VVRCWTWEREVWGSIPGTLVMYKILGQDLHLHCLWPPSSNGYLVHRLKVCVAALISAVLARGKVKVHWTMHKLEYLDSKQILYLYLFILCQYLSQIYANIVLPREQSSCDRLCWFPFLAANWVAWGPSDIRPSCAPAHLLIKTYVSLHALLVYLVTTMSVL
jgi:hypothetical protein